MAYTIKFTVSPVPGLLLDLIAVIYKTTASASEVDRILLDDDHSAPVNCQFNDLAAGTYIIKIHESSDGSTLQNLRHDWWQDARTGKILFERRFYRVDGGGDNDPVSTAPDNTKIVDPYLDGKTVSGVFQEGYRYLIPTTEWAQVTAGQINLLNDVNTGGQITNNNGQVWAVEILYTIQESSSSDNQPFTDIIPIIEDQLVDSTLYNKIMVATPSSTSLTVTNPTIGSIPDGKGLMVVHDGGNAINVKWICQSGQVFRFRGVDVNAIYLAKGEFVKVIKKGTKLYVVDYRGQWDRIGEVVQSDILIDNSLVMDGTEYDGAQYLRIYNWIKDVLPSGQKTDFTEWSTHTDTIRAEVVFTKQSLFAIDTVAVRFKVPNRLNISPRSVKNVGGADATRIDNVPGGYQHDEIRTTNFNVTVGSANRSNSDSGSGKLAVGGDSPEGGDITLPATIGTGPDTHVKNYGVLPLLLI